MAKELLEPDYAGRIGIPSFQLTNNNAKINAAIKKIEALERRSVQKDSFKTIEFDGGTIDIVDGRVVVDHDERPSKETITKLKSYGFRWTPSIGSWTRKHTEAAVRDAKWAMDIRKSRNESSIRKSRILVRNR